MTRVIDAHAHLWRVDDGWHGWLGEPGLERINTTFTAEELCARTSLAGVDAVILIEGGTNSAADTAMLLEQARKSSRFAGVVGWIELLSPALEGELSRLKTGPLGRKTIGIRTQVQHEADDYLDRDDVRNGIAAIGRAGLPFELVLRASGRPAALDLVAALPETRFVVDHLGAPDFTRGRPTRAWTRWMSALAAHENVDMKLSALGNAGPAVSNAGVRELVDVALREFGPQRLAWGSDWPVSLLHHTYAQSLGLALEVLGGLSAPERGWVFGGTAERLYGLAPG